MSSKATIADFDFSRPFLPSAEVLHQQLEGETVLLDLDSERYFGLDETGTRIWALLIQHQRPEVVLEHMLQEFEVDEETLKADIADLLTRLLDSGLIRPAEATK